MEEMERAERGVHARAGDPPNFLNAAGIEALLFDFETYRNPSTPFTDGDRIAEMVLVRVVPETGEEWYFLAPVPDAVT